MYNIKGIEELRARMQVLELQQGAQWKEMKSGVSDTYERLKPANLIRNAFDGLADTVDPDSDILKEGAAMLSGMIVNSIMSGSKNKPLKRWLTLALFSVASYFIAHYREDIVDAGNKVVSYISDRMNNVKVKRAARKARKEAMQEMDDDMD